MFRTERIDVHDGNNLGKDCFEDRIGFGIKFLLRAGCASYSLYLSKFMPSASRRGLASTLHLPHLFWPEAENGVFLNF